MELASRYPPSHPHPPNPMPLRHLQQVHVCVGVPVALFCHSAANWDDSDFAALALAAEMCGRRERLRS